MPVAMPVAIPHAHDASGMITASFPVLVPVVFEVVPPTLVTPPAPVWPPIAAPPLAIADRRSLNQ
jgi:hypothetical protein